MKIKIKNIVFSTFCFVITSCIYSNHEETEMIKGDDNINYKNELTKLTIEKNAAKKDLRVLNKTYISTDCYAPYMLKAIEDKRNKFSEYREKCKKLSELADADYESSGDEDNWFTKEEREKNEKLRQKMKNFFFFSKEVSVSIGEKVYPTLKFISSNPIINLFVKTSLGIDMSCIEPLVAAFLGTAKVLDHIIVIQEKSNKDPNYNAFRDIAECLGDLLIKICKEKKKQS